jgi:hypothetical protein
MFEAVGNECGLEQEIYVAHGAADVCDFGAENGADVYTMSKLLGHKSIE